uniref:Uncharacterized protein n=1 Tax=mine drainage metagenome TaxID=410659 RepID=E6QRV5_9ZZZZ
MTHPGSLRKLYAAYHITSRHFTSQMTFSNNQVGHPRALTTKMICPRIIDDMLRSNECSTYCFSTP